MIVIPIRRSCFSHLLLLSYIDLEEPGIVTMASHIINCFITIVIKDIAHISALLLASTFITYIITPPDLKDPDSTFGDLKYAEMLHHWCYSFRHHL
jgi:hypothetical protein